MSKHCKNVPRILLAWLGVAVAAACAVHREFAGVTMTVVEVLSTVGVICERNATMPVLNSRFRSAAIWGAAVLGVAVVGCAAPAFAAQSSPAPQLVIHRYAAVGTETKPDDLTRLGDSIYVAFQNGVGSMGEPAPGGGTASTIQQYSLSGAPGKSWTVTGKIDGMTADPASGRILASVNEDGNSSFVALDPSEPSAKTYSYTGLTHGGGTDAISIFDHQIVLSASAPSNPSGPAVYTVKLSGATAQLTPLFADNATAVAVNGPTGGKTVNLALTDPDSSRVVPQSSPRFAGSFMLDGQADMQLIFLSQERRSPAKLSVLTVSTPLDDTAFATSSHQTLWLTDPVANELVSVTGVFTSGEAVSTVTPDIGPSYLATLNLTTGALTPVPGLGTMQPKGLIFTSSHHGDDDGHGDDEGHDHH